MPQELLSRRREFEISDSLEVGVKRLIRKKKTQNRRSGVNVRTDQKLTWSSDFDE